MFCKLDTQQGWEIYANFRDHVHQCTALIKWIVLYIVALLSAQTLLCKESFLLTSEKRRHVVATSMSITANFCKALFLCNYSPLAARYYFYN